MARHFTRAALIALVAAVLPIAVAGYGDNAQHPTATAMQGTAAIPMADPAKETVYSKDFFGPWNAGVAKAHLPQITCEKTGDGLKVTVKVDNHPMNPEVPHYIMWIRIEDGKGNVLGKKDFVATDPAPIATFTLTTAPDKIKAFERCNIHGTWTSETDVK
jgi:desulfoferrodoxin-like iron-binding protein